MWFTDPHPQITVKSREDPDKAKRKGRSRGKGGRSSLRVRILITKHSLQIEANSPSIRTLHPHATRPNQSTLTTPSVILPPRPASRAACCQQLRGTSLSLLRLHHQHILGHRPHLRREWTRKHPRLQTRYTKTLLQLCSMRHSINLNPSSSPSTLTQASMHR